MKRYKLLVFILSLIIIVCLNNGVTYSYFKTGDRTDTQSIILGNLKIETNNTPQNCWRYTPVAVEGNKYTSNGAIDTKKLSGALESNNLRPGDAFEKDITITNIGSLTSKLKITKGILLNDSPFRVTVNPKGNDANVTISNDANDKNTWYVDSLKTNAKVIFTIKLELPIDITNNDLNENNIRLSNSALELLNIVSTQWNNNTWSE